MEGLFDLKNLIEKELSNIETFKEEIKPYISEVKMKRLKGSILHDFYNAC